MCPIPASEEFITDYGDSLFASLSFLSLKPNIFHWIQWTALH